MSEKKSESNQPSSETEQHASTLLSTLLTVSNVGPKGSEPYRLVRRGTQKLMDDLLRAQEPAPRVDKELVNAMIAEIDRRLTAQINLILHHPQVQKLESAWRGLKFLVDRADTDQGVKVEFISATKEDLKVDFEDAPDITQSGLYDHVYRKSFGTLGGKPYGVVCSTYDFSYDGDDLQLLKQCAAVAAMSHAPFLGNVAPKMFGLSSFTELGKVKDLPSLLEGGQYARWHALRESEDARYLGMCAPRFMLRAPYGEQVRVPDTSPEKISGGQVSSEPPVTAFAFAEEVIDRHDNYLWGAASLALAAQIAESFAKFHWGPNIIGPQGGGQVSGLPLHAYEQAGEFKVKSSTEFSLDDQWEHQLAEEGFIPLVFRKHSQSAVFFSANSVQKPRLFPRTPEGQAQQRNFKVGTQLPYLFVITRLAHYMKVLQREQIGAWKTRSDLERELNNWIRGYVSDMPDPSPETRSRKPLRKAAITVEEVPGQGQWFRCSLQVQPHFKLEGVDIDLGLVGKLDRT
jgi:type VI secretion system protein ImpC